MWFNDRGSLYEVREDLLKTVVSNLVEAEEVARYSGKEFERESMGTGLPTIYYVAVDWDHVHRVRRESVPPLLEKFQARLAKGQLSVQDARHELHQMATETWWHQRYTHRRMQAAHEASIASADSHVFWYSVGLAASKFVAALSKDVLIIGATAASGGTAALGLAGASLVSGTVTYMETKARPVRAALWDAGTTITFGVVQIASPAAGLGRRVVVAFAKGGAETVGSLIEGKSVGEALTDGAVDAAGDVLFSELTSSGWARKSLKKTIVPGLRHIKVNRGGHMRDLGVRQGTKAAEQFAGSLLKGSVSFGRDIARASERSSETAGLSEDEGRHDSDPMCIDSMCCIEDTSTFADQVIAKVI
jgi:hypothetical protein